MEIKSSSGFVLVTGGLGYIGSHVVVKLMAQNHNVLIYDNLSNSDISVKDRIIDIAGRSDLLTFVEGDIRNEYGVRALFDQYHIHTVMHFAALKSVGESDKYSELYNDVNVQGTKKLLHIMKNHGCKTFIYSSSATVYGDSAPPVIEESNVGNNLTCNYARNKYDIEQYLIANHQEGKGFIDWNITILRYFNPIGAHPSGKIGENPNGIPNNVFPYLLKVAKWANTDVSERDADSPYSFFTIFGDSYETRDGTCIRDYIHVQDLARAHVQVLDVMGVGENKLRIYNVGTGTDSTVLELVECLNKVLRDKNKKTINYIIGNKRDGDLDISYAIVDKIYREVGFRTEYDVMKMCEHGLGFIGL